MIYDYDPDAIDFPDHYDLCAWCGQLILIDGGTLSIPDEANLPWLLELDRDRDSLCWSCYVEGGGR